MFSKSKRLGLVILLMAALVFMGINFLKAKKPQQWKWSVMLQGYNLYGDGGIYENNNEDLLVMVTEGMSTINRAKVNKFILQIESTSGRFVGFKDLTLYEFSSDETLPCCQFPNCSNSDPCTPPSCMEDFLNNYPHPSWDYAGFYLVIEIDYDFEDMEKCEVVNNVPGMVQIYVINTLECLEEPSEEDHNVEFWAYDPAQGSCGCYIDIKKAEEENTWTIYADIPSLLVSEHYRVYLGGSRGKGGKGKGPGDNKYPFSTITSFNFTTTWTRALQ